MDGASAAKQPGPDTADQHADERDDVDIHQLPGGGEEAEHQQRDGVGDEVAEADVEERSEEDAHQP